MNKLLLLVAVALLSTAHQASACDMGAITAYVAETVVACAGQDCATHEPVTQQPTAKPETVAPKVAECSTCAVEQPDTPALPQTPEDGGGSCTSCAMPTPPVQRLTDGGSCTSCAVDEPISSEPFTKPIVQEPKGCSGLGCATPVQRVHVAGCDGC